MRQWRGGKEPEYRRKQQDAHEREHHANQQEEVIRTIVSIRTSIDGMSAEHAANRQQAETHERSKRKRELSTFWALVAAASAAILTLIVAHCDNIAIVRQAKRDAAQQHRDTVSALGKTDIAVAESRRLADAANKSADLAEASARAWIAPIQFAFVHPTDTADPLKVRIGIQNVGREPARALTHYLGVGFIPFPSLPPAQWSDLPEWKETPFFDTHGICSHLTNVVNYSVVYPSAFYITFFNMPIISPMPINDIKGKRAVYFVGGCFSYESLGVRRYTTFCVYANPAGQGDNFAQWPFSSCPVGNDDYTEGEKSGH